MTRFKSSRTLAAAGIVSALLTMAACDVPVYVRTSGITGDGSSERDGGDGATHTGGTGGTNTGSGGSVAVATGGVSASGGSASGGTSSGGAAATGGTSGTGGGAGSGGAGTGGSASGGSTPGTGGAAFGTGGMIGTGGRPGTGGAGTGGAGTGGAGTGGAGTGGAAATDTAKYNFEASAQSWVAIGAAPTFSSVVRSTALRFAGQAALAGSIAATGAGIFQLGVAPTTAVPAGATITFHVFFPAGSTLDSIQPYALAGGAWTGNYTAIGLLTAGAWNTITVVVPTPFGTIGQIGVQFHVTGAWSGTVYVDSVNW